MTNGWAALLIERIVSLPSTANAKGGRVASALMDPTFRPASTGCAGFEIFTVSKPPTGKFVWGPSRGSNDDSKATLPERHTRAGRKFVAKLPDNEGAAG